MKSIFAILVFIFISKITLAEEQIANPLPQNENVEYDVVKTHLFLEPYSCENRNRQFRHTGLFLSKKAYWGNSPQLLLSYCGNPFFTIRTERANDSVILDLGIVDIRSVDLKELKQRLLKTERKNENPNPGHAYAVLMRPSDLDRDILGLNADDILIFKVRFVGEWNGKPAAIIDYIVRKNPDLSGEAK